MTTLHFAQISDIHISVLGNHHDMLSGHSPDFLSGIIRRLNQMEPLDFVLITGDLFDTAVKAEVDQFQTIIQTLKKPYYIIPGNHDRRNLDQNEGLTRHQFAQLFNPQVAARPTDPTLQAGYWSVSLTPEVQLIGLDSIKDTDWGGRVDQTQLAWLENELVTHASKLTLVTIHHPLHKLAPIDDLPEWRNFVCDNGPELMALLHRHPQVKVVLTGHHHLSKVERLNARWHISTPSIAGYPCAYRTFRLSRQSEQWHLAWQTHPSTDPEMTAEARRLMAWGWQEFAGFAPDFVEDYVARALGNEYDQNGTAVL